MPYSADESRPWSIALLRSLAEPPQSFVDVGAGAGWWLDALRSEFPSARYTAVEIFEPYVEQFALRDRYDDVIVGDIREIGFPTADAVILGDVLEHMEAEEAVSVWNRARSAAGSVVVAALPIVPYPQDACFGNEHERHLVTWTHEDVLALLPGIDDWFVGRVVGAYAATGLAHSD